MEVFQLWFRKRVGKNHPGRGKVFMKFLVGNQKIFLARKFFFIIGATTELAQIRKQHRIVVGLGISPAPELDSHVP